MAIFKPEVKEGNSSSFTGICEFGLLEFTDKSNDFDWCRPTPMRAIGGQVCI